MALNCQMVSRRVVVAKAPGVRAVPVRPAVRRTAAVKVVAYRDAHREEKICSLGSEVVNSWFKGIAMGPEAAREALQADCDTTVAYRSHQVLRHHKGQGLDYLLKRINVGHEKMDLVSHRILATAACSLDDTFFALVEYKYKSKVLGDPRVNVGYKIMEMDVMYDDTCLKVMGLHERSSLSPEDVSVIASLDSAHNAGNATPFPEDDLADYPGGLNNEIVLANSRAWCQARSSGQPESVLDRTLDPSFRLWDAYGVLPVLCDPSRRGKVDACVVKYDQVKDIIASTKDRYDIKCKLIDNAVSLNKNVGFTHWRSRIVNKDTKAAFEIEAVEVDLFGADGRLKDIWMFRDPMDVEIEMLQGRK
uniref:Uncharacterized protein n=1 Tax=Tetradesmus obliquus TaxID=3088 RepID=A0A383VV95_TETOB|eukprot:jgi/Sobl393_1/16146/SZX68712.1